MRFLIIFNEIYQHLECWIKLSESIFDQCMGKRFIQRNHRLVGFTETQYETFIGMVSDSDCNNQNIHIYQEGYYNIPSFSNCIYARPGFLHILQLKPHLAKDRLQKQVSEANYLQWIQTSKIFVSMQKKKIQNMTHLLLKFLFWKTVTVH